VALEITALIFETRPVQVADTRVFVSRPHIVLQNRLQLAMTFQCGNHLACFRVAFGGSCIRRSGRGDLQSLKGILSTGGGGLLCETTNETMEARTQNLMKGLNQTHPSSVEHVLSDVPFPVDAAGFVSAGLPDAAANDAQTSVRFDFPVPGSAEDDAEGLLSSCFLLDFDDAKPNRLVQSERATSFLAPCPCNDPRLADSIPAPCEEVDEPDVLDLT
jgi:hypothetical protein